MCLHYLKTELCEPLYISCLNIIVGLSRLLHRHTDSGPLRTRRLSSLWAHRAVKNRKDVAYLFRDSEITQITASAYLFTILSTYPNYI